MIKAHNTITANSIPDFRNWPQAGRGEDEGNVTGYCKQNRKLTYGYANV